MDVELSELGEAVGASEAEGLPVSTCSPHTALSHKPSAWASCKAASSKYKVHVLFLSLAVICLCAGVGVYFATMRNGWINIHLVPHSHDDVGWLRTPENYYQYTVKYILNNVIHELEKNPHRKFVYAETYFLWRWWNEQTNLTQALVRQLVDRGQLEFAGGAWSMNDEATPYYLNIIDQFTWGLRRLNDIFGERGRPTVSWQIDTFGHSREMASLSAQMGFDGMFFARIDEEERSQRRDRRAMEFMWEDRGGATSILTSVLFKHYNPPSGYDYEETTHEGANLDGFLEAVREWAYAYRTTHVLVPMGDDFTYYDARIWFDNMDALIKQVEERKDSGINVNLFYSTPSQYLRAIKDTPARWPTKSDSDFFPYGSDIFSYWTGYFSSRPSLKLFERVSSNFLQMVKQLLAMTGVNPDSEDRLTELREVLGVMMHHDALTGTAKQGVTDHYISLLHSALSLCVRPVLDAVRTLSFALGRVEPLAFEPCLLLNVSSCFVSERSPKFVVMAYNALSWDVSRVVRLPVLARNYIVWDVNGEEVASQLVPLPPEVAAAPGRPGSAVQELVFQTGKVPAFGFTSFFIAIKPPSVGTPPVFLATPGNMKLSFHQYTGRLAGVTKGEQSFAVEQDLEYYYGSSFWTGAYIFRPSDPYPYAMGGQLVNREAAVGPVVQEVHQTMGPWASQVLRVYQGAPYLEIEWMVGPIPIEDYHGKEVIARYSSKIKSKGEFYTDTNGRGSLRRRRNKRDDWVYSAHEAVSGNYYPVTSHISVRDSSSQIFVLTDRAQGGSSIRDGQVELMVHRRLCYDDGKGVNEALNETEFGQGLVVRGRHWLLLGDGDPALEQKAKLLGTQLQSEPFLLLAPTDLDFQTWQYSHLTRFAGFQTYLPDRIRLLTLEPWRDGLVLLRLEHMFEKNSAAPLSLPATIQLKRIFSTFDIDAFRETMLAADRWLLDDRGWEDGAALITLQPATINTYLVQITRRHSFF